MPMSGSGEIAQRTRSKHPLHDISITSLEAGLGPVEGEDPPTPRELDPDELWWHQWLNSLSTDPLNGTVHCIVYVCVHTVWCMCVVNEHSLICVRNWSLYFVYTTALIHATMQYVSHFSDPIHLPYTTYPQFLRLYHATF